MLYSVRKNGVRILKTKQGENIMIWKGLFEKDGHCTTKSLDNEEEHTLKQCVSDLKRRMVHEGWILISEEYTTYEKFYS